jgi:SAM-dependent methyltransferase
LPHEHEAPAPGFVSVPSGTGGGRLAAPVRAGIVDLSEVVHVSGVGADLLAERAPLEPASVARALLERGAPSAAVAEEDARRFLDSLDGRASRSVGAAAVLPAACGDPATRARRAEVGADDLERLAREVLGRGLCMRYRASGRSMRPWIRHGAWLEVEPRSFERLRPGDVALYSAGEHRLVAHRVFARRGALLLARGDSSLRLDQVGPAEYLGRVRACSGAGGREVDLTRPWRRWLALLASPLWRAGALLAGLLVVRPLRWTFGRRSVLRGALRGLLRASSGALLLVERSVRRLRSPVDVARAALSSAQEKDEERRALYARRTVQGFTSLEENVDAGLTLLEEACLARHALAPGRALVLGCGPGRECLSLARRGFRVVGVDREEGMLARARELAREAALPIEFLRQEALEVRVEGEPFEYVVIFSGLLNMVLPRARRVALLARSNEHLAPGGRVLVTFLSAYRSPGEPPPPRARTFWQAVNPEHEPGDLFLLNESVHVFPIADDLVSEAREAGLEVEHLFRDQRAYDRAEGRVRGYAILRRPGPRPG